VNGVAIGLGVAGGVVFLIIIGLLGYKYYRSLSGPALTLDEPVLTLTPNP